MLEAIKEIISGVFFAITWLKFSQVKLYTKEKELIKNIIYTISF